MVLPVQKVEPGACCLGGGSCWKGAGRAVAACRKRAPGSTAQAVVLTSRQAQVAAGSEVPAGTGVG